MNFFKSSNSRKEEVSSLSIVLSPVLPSSRGGRMWVMAEHPCHCLLPSVLPAPQMPPPDVERKPFEMEETKRRAVIHVRPLPAALVPVAPWFRRPCAGRSRQCAGAPRVAGLCAPSLSPKLFLLPSAVPNCSHVPLQVRSLILK